MDRLYRGVETTLLLGAFALCAAALAISTLMPLGYALPDSVTLSMLTVVADRAAPPER